MNRYCFVLSFLLFHVAAGARTPVDTLRIYEWNQKAQAALNDDLDRALDLAQKALSQSKKTGYTRGLFMAQMNLGEVWYYKMDFNKALEHTLEACRLGEQFHYSKHLVECYYQVGKIHRHLKNFEKALGFSRKGLRLALAIKDNKSISALYNGIGNIFGEQKQYDSSIYYYRKRISLLGKKDKESIASAMANLGAVFSRRNQYDSALHYYRTSLQLTEGSSLYEKDRGFRKFIGGIYYLMAETHYALGETDQAETYGLHSEEIVVKDSAKKEMIETYRFLAKVYSAKKDFEKAYGYQEKYSHIKDQVFKEENARQFAEMETRYQTEKKEQEIRIKNIKIEKEQQRSRFIATVAFVAILSVFLLGWFLYYRYRSRQQQKFDAELRHQQKLRYKAVMDAQEQEKKRIAAELHDGLGQILATARIHISGVEEHNSVLENKKFLDTGLNLLDNAAAEVRTISHQMMPAALVRTGFVQAVNDLVKKINATGKTQFMLRDHLPEDFDPGQENTIHLFRITQEITTNCIKHAKARTADLDLALDKNNLVLVYTDDGRGLSALQISESKGIGWKNIFSRVELLDGKIGVDTDTGCGLQIKITVPLNR